MFTLLLKTLLLSFAEAWFCREGTQEPRVKRWGGWMLERNSSWSAHQRGSHSPGGWEAQPPPSTHTWTWQQWWFYLQNRKALYSKNLNEQEARNPKPSLTSDSCNQLIRRLKYLYFMFLLLKKKKKTKTPKPQSSVCTHFRKVQEIFWYTLLYGTYPLASLDHFYD